MRNFNVKIEKVNARGKVVERERVKVKADNAKAAARESNFVREMRFVGGEYGMRIYVEGELIVNA